MAGRQVAVAGLGGMGGAMALRLVESGFDVTVWNRTPERVTSVADAGAHAAVTAAEAASASSVVILSLSDEEAVEQVLFGQMIGALADGVVVVDTTTVSPGYARQAARRMADAGVRRVEAALLGNPAMARQGKLRVLAAGDAAAVTEVQDVTGALGAEVRHLGGPGRAVAVKLAFNLVLGAQIVALAEAAALGESVGVDRNVLLAAIGESGFSSPVMAFRGDIMRRRAYQPAAFRSTLMHKDLRLAVQEGAGQGRRLPLTTCAAELFAAAVAAGDGDKDAAVIAEYAIGRHGNGSTD